METLKPMLWGSCLIIAAIVMMAGGFKEKSPQYNSAIKTHIKTLKSK